MSDCRRNWEPGKDCLGCWAIIFRHLTLKPGTMILPRPDFCQDAAFVAFMIDSLRTTVTALTADVDELKDALSEARGGEPTRIQEIFDEARLEAAEADER